MESTGVMWDRLRCGLWWTGREVERTAVVLGFGKVDHSISDRQVLK